MKIKYYIFTTIFLIWSVNCFANEIRIYNATDNDIYVKYKNCEISRPSNSLNCQTQQEIIIHSKSSVKSYEVIAPMNLSNPANNSYEALIIQEVIEKDQNGAIIASVDHNPTNYLDYVHSYLNLSYSNATNLAIVFNELNRSDIIVHQIFGYKKLG